MASNEDRSELMENNNSEAYPVRSNSDKTTTFSTGKMTGQRKRISGETPISTRNDGTRKPSTAKKGKKKKKKSSNHVAMAVLLVLLIFLVSAIISTVIIKAGRDMLGITGTSESVVITVPQGATVSDIADILQDNGVIESPFFFKVVTKLSGSEASFRGGNYEVRKNMAYETLINTLTNEAITDDNVATVTFEEGITLSIAAQKLEIAEVCDAKDFLDAFNNAEDLGFDYEDHLPEFSNNLKFYKMEGYLFPDTYKLYKGMSADLVVQKIMENFNDHITSDLYDRMDELGLTLDETLTFASLVQEEANNSVDMKKVAGVFWNRLNDPDEYPRLQSDTTYSYIDEVIKPNSEEINQDMVDAYDTYTCTGLPVGAICNPGMDAINAVLYPTESENYYFFADVNSGKVYYSKTYEEHQAVIKKVNEQYGIYEENTEVLTFDATETMYNIENGTEGNANYGQ